MKRWRWVYVAVLMSLAIGVSVAGCGGDDDDDDDAEATVDPSLPDEEQIELTLERYAAALDAEDWDAVCGLFAVEVISNFSCADIRRSFESSGEAAGTSDVHVRITPGLIEQDGIQGEATYEICVAYRPRPETCSEETVHMVKEAEGWKVGQKRQESPSPSPPVP